MTRILETSFILLRNILICCAICYVNINVNIDFQSNIYAAEFYVAPNGKPDNSGTKSEPFGTLEDARNAIRSARITKSIQPDESVTVYLATGKYLLSKSFELKQEDSGTEKNPVVYRSETPLGAELIGGFVVPVSAFKKINDPEILKRLDPAVHGKVFVADLNALNIPAMNQWANQFKGRPNTPPELFFNNEPMTVARFPNHTWAGFKTTLDNGLPHNEKTDETNKKIAEKKGVEFVHSETDTKKLHGGSFLYDEETLKNRISERVDCWDSENGIWLCGYWTHDWSDEVLKVASIDTKQKIMTLLGVHSYGIGGQSWAGYSERRYFAMNLLEELDTPQEWYLDRKTNQLYFYPPKDLSDSSTIILSTLDQPLVLLNGSSFVRFQEIALGPTFGNGIEIRGGTKNAVLACRISGTGRGGIVLNGGTTNLVRSCDLYHIGGTAVSINGGDRKTLTSAEHLAENNHIYHFGRLQRTYAGAFGLQGVGNIVRNNLIHDAPHLAILYGGNENRIERNEIYHVVQETSDAGALYTGRDWTTQGNIIAENYIHDLGTSDSHGTMGVYLDDCDCGDIIQRNIFYKASRAVFIGGGRDNIAENNLFIECYQGISLDSRGMTWKQWNSPDDSSWQLERKAKELNYQNPPWSERYPKLATIMQNEPKAPLGCIFQRNVMVDCKQWLHVDGNVLKLLERTDLKDNIIISNNVIVENLVKSEDDKLPSKEKSLQKYLVNFESGFMDYDNRNFNLKSDSLLRQHLPDKFEPIPFDKIGLFVDEYRTVLPKK
ncbi:MAG: right-handed parallel beta-helix repeat-containing protein [Planctomycetaceae bacterium]|jgi:hypothetical protein|nr:right-handed parallel beta-helix repeat-containing protein [Planctomycetaceae bacterium]